MKSKVSIVSNLWMRQVELEKGETYGGHSHQFDHFHLLCVGSLTMTSGDRMKEKRFDAPQMIFIPKDDYHEFTALTDKTLGFCIHPIRVGKRIEDIISPDMVLDYDDVNAVSYNWPLDDSIVEQSEAVPWDVAKKELE